MYDDGLMHIASTKTFIFHCVFRNFFFSSLKKTLSFFALKLICIQLHLHKIYLYIHTRTRYARKYLTRDYARGSTIYRAKKKNFIATVSVFKKIQKKVEVKTWLKLKIVASSSEKKVLLCRGLPTLTAPPPPSTAQITKWWLKRFDYFFSPKPSTKSLKLVLV